MYLKGDEEKEWKMILFEIKTVGVNKPLSWVLLRSALFKMKMIGNLLKSFWQTYDERRREKGEINILVTNKCERVNYVSFKWLKARTSRVDDVPDNVNVCFVWRVGLFICGRDNKQISMITFHSIKQRTRSGFGIGRGGDGIVVDEKRLGGVNELVVVAHFEAFAVVDHHSFVVELVPLEVLRDGHAGASARHRSTKHRVDKCRFLNTHMHTSHLQQTQRF